MSVAHILGTKGRGVITASPDDTVHAAATTLSEKRIGAVVAVGRDGSIGGIVSERDIVRALAQHGAKAMTLKLSEIMTKQVHTCAPADSEADLMGLMTAKRVRHLPVVEHGKLVGMISIGDVVKFRIEAIEREADEMKTYIASAG